MIRRPPRSTCTATRFLYTTVFRAVQTRRGCVGAVADTLQSLPLVREFGGGRIVCEPCRKEHHEQGGRHQRLYRNATDRWGDQRLYRTAFHSRFHDWLQILERISSIGSLLRTTGVGAPIEGPSCLNPACGDMLDVRSSVSHS